MNDEFTTPPKRPTRRSWPGRAVLASTRKELGILRSLLPEGSQDRGMISGMVQLTSWPDLVLAGPILGAPQAALVLEYLNLKGVRSFLYLGWCGSLRPELKWGDLFLPDSFLSEEGVSAHYPLEGGPAGPDPGLCDRLSRDLSRRGLDLKKGRIWTTDAPYRETRDKVRGYAAAGIMAVDMEVSAFMTVAAFTKLSWAGLLVVSDELWGDVWRPGFDSPELTAGLTSAAETIMSVFE